MLVSQLDGKKGAVLDRIVQAYGFERKSQYAERVGLSSSNLAMRYRRDAFPADLVLQALIDTDASLEWLISGKGEPPTTAKKKTVTQLPRKLPDGEQLRLERLILDKSELKINGELVFDSLFFGDFYHVDSDLVVVQSGKTQYIVDRHYTSVADGKWLVDIEGSISIRNLSRIPVGRVKVTGGETEFECAVTDISVIGAVVMVCE